MTNSVDVEPAMEWLLAHAEEDFIADEINAKVEPVVCSAESTESVEAAPESPIKETGDCLRLSQTISAQTSRTRQASESPTTTLTETLLKLTCTQGAVPKTHTKTRIQVRLSDGSVLTKTFNISEHLSSVRLWVQSKLTHQPVSFITNFPSKVFTEVDYEKTLEVLNLVPSAMLIVPQAPEKTQVIISEKDTNEVKRSCEEIETKKFIEERKRELEEERLARQRVLAIIEDDKAARKLRYGS